MPRIEPPAPSEYGPYYRPYVERVPEGDVLAFLHEQPSSLRALLETVGEDRAGHRYAPEKWTVRQVVGHVIDTERVFAYRALRISRGDPTPLPGFDQDLFTARDRLEGRSLADLAGAFQRLRASNMDLFASFDDEMLRRTGTVSDKTVSVRAILYIVAGHAAHHASLIEQRYLAPTAP